jgi:hypothetical protein
MFEEGAPFLIPLRYVASYGPILVAIIHLEGYNSLCNARGPSNDASEGQ